MFMAGPSHISADERLVNPRCCIAQSSSRVPALNCAYVAGSYPAATAAIQHLLRTLRVQRHVRLPHVLALPMSRPPSSTRLWLAV